MLYNFKLRFSLMKKEIKMTRYLIVAALAMVMMSGTAYACGGNCDMSKCNDPAKCGSMVMDMSSSETIAKADGQADGAVTVTNDKYKLIYKVEEDAVDYYLYDKATGKAIDTKGITGKLTLDNGKSYGIGVMAMGDEPKAHLMSMDNVGQKQLKGKVIFKLSDGSRIMFELK